MYIDIGYGWERKIDMTTKKSRDTIQSLRLGISIIDCLVDENRPLKVADIQEKTNITKSNLYKYLNTLLEADLIYRDKDTGLYYLGSKLIQYGMAAIENQDIVTKVTPFLQELSQRTNNSVIFAVPTHNGPIIVKMIRANQILNIGAELGALLPPNSSAGKVFHAFSSDWIVDNWMGLDDSIISDEELTYIQKEKIAFAREPLISEISSVAIPIISFDGELAGIISVVGFTSDIPDKMDHPTSKYIQKMQADISKNF